MTEVTVRRVVVVVTILAVIGLGVAGIGSALERGEPDIDVYLPDNEVLPGETETIELAVQNAGDVHVGTGGGETLIARGVTVEIDDAGPFEARSGETPIGPVADGETATAAHRIDVPADIEPGEYEISVTVRYSYTGMVSERAGVVQRMTARERQDVTVVVRDAPRFAVSTIESDIEPGASGEVTIEITNVGTETASNLRGTFNGTQSVTLDGGIAEVAIGRLAPGETTTVNLDVAMEQGTSVDAKPIEAVFQYDRPSGVPGETRSVTTSLVPGERPTFSVTDLGGTLAVGTDGTIRGTIINDGPRTVNDAVLTLDPGSESISVENTRYALQSLEPGEETSFTYPTTVDASADAGPRQLRFSVEYSATSGSVLETDPMTERVIVQPAVEFSITAVDDTLSVGYDGEIWGDIRNDGPRAIVDPVLVVEPMSDSLFVEDTRYALPQLDVGESTRFRYPVDVSGQADPGPRQFRFVVEYTDGEGSVVETDPMSHRIEIDPKQDEFSVTPLAASIDPGDTTELVLEITNERPETLSNIDALLFTESPLSSPGDEAFVDELAPGESSTISFEISADSNARATTYPVEFDFEYTTERGRTELSDTYRIGVEVTDNPDGGNGGILPGLGTIGLLVGIALLGLVAVFVWRRQ